MNEVAKHPCGYEADGGERTAVNWNLSGGSLQVQMLQQRNKLLHAKLRSMTWPLLTSFEAYGHTYGLPLRASANFSTACAEVPQMTYLRYLAGFFDGDGCCTSHSRSSIFLSIHQSFDRAEILVLFRSVFGGGIGRGKPGRGLRKPILQWQLFGTNASNAAKLLAPHSIVKRRQLELANDSFQAQRRQALKPRMKALKLHDSCVVGLCTWEYLAGFFDAEGNISVGEGTVNLFISQKFATVLECLCRFLDSELGCNLCVRHCRACWRLEVTTTYTSKRILQNMLQAGLVQKAKQARLALAVTPANSIHIRGLLFDLVGNQRFGKRLDHHGIERARKIRAACRRARYALRKGKQNEASATLQDVEILKSDHELQKARLENEQLQAYILNLRKLQLEHSILTDAKRFDREKVASAWPLPSISQDLVPWIVHGSCAHATKPKLERCEAHV